MPSRLRTCRSLLYFPASNARAAEKARTLGADLLILDCEDSVKDDDKALARESAVAALDRGFGACVTALRINADERWHREDLVAAVRCAADYVVLPKVEHAGQIERVADAGGKPVLAMVETPQGLLSVLEIARVSAGLIAGTNDLAAALGIPSSAGRAGLTHSLQRMVLAARAVGIAAFDGVYNRLEDDEGLAAECREGRAFGFDGKSLIHPRQIDTANRIFSPSDEDIAAARRLIAAAKGGAERFEGRMIEAMHVAEAENILSKARL